MRGVNEWTTTELKNLPLLKWGEELGEFDSLVILPTNEVHDSGYMCMDFIAVFGNEPKYRLSGHSDVVHLNGIGGFGYNWFEKYKSVPAAIPPTAWSMDCLKESGLLRLFATRKLVIRPPVSSFEVYSK